MLDDAAFGAASSVTPKFISPSDPAAQWTGSHKGHAFFAYATNYLIDTDHGVILDVEATGASRQAEVGASRTMIQRVEDHLGGRERPLHLPGRQGIEAIPPDLRNAEIGHYRRRHAPLQGQERRLRCLRTQAALLPENAMRKVPRDQRGCPGRRESDCHHT